MILYYILGFILILVVVMTIKMMTFRRVIEPTLKWNDVSIDETRIAKKMSEAVKIDTISYMDRSLINYDKFYDYHKMLKDGYPLVHDQLELTKIHDYSLVYKWQGKNSQKKPILFMAHFDVVPIAEGTEGDWTHPPFSGLIEDGFVWGRGSIDTKVTMISCLEGVELLLEKNFVPDRDIYMAFGHDEEIQGRDGATNTVAYFKEKGIQFEYVLDEGGIVSVNSVAGVKNKVALIGISEKGYADIELVARGDGGHASMPPKSTALGQIAKAITKIENNQMPMQMTAPVKIFLKTVGPSMGGVNRFILANMWLFKALFMKIFSTGGSGNAMLRTTTAVTMSEASNASNVLPQTAKATINFRILPGDSTNDIVNHIKRVTEGIDLEVNVIKGNEPSGISSATSNGFKQINKVINHVFDHPIVSPYLVMAATDSRYYEEVADDVYRFAPIVLSKEELGMIHGTNERISMDNLNRCVSFYMHLMMAV